MYPTPTDFCYKLWFQAVRSKNGRYVTDSGQRLREIHGAREKTGFQASSPFIRLLIVAEKF